MRTTGFFMLGALLAAGPVSAQPGRTVAPPAVCDGFDDDDYYEECMLDYAAFKTSFGQALAGNTKAMMIVANDLSGNDPVKQDRAAANYWYERAANAGSGEAMFTLAEFYRAGLYGYPKNPQQMLNWYRKADAANYYSASINLAHVYREGTVVPRDYAKANALFRRAAEAKVPMAMLNLGNAYRNGEGVAKDAREAAAWYARASAAQPTWGQPMLALASLQLSGGPGLRADTATAISTLEAIADGKRKNPRAGGADLPAYDPEWREAAYHELGRIYDTGTGAYDNKVRAIGYYERGTSQSQLNAGLLLANGTGVARDPVRALTFYERAMYRNNTQARYLAAMAYRLGRGATEDKARARTHMKIAAEKGYPAAMFEYGYMLSLAEGGPQDIPGSVKWYKQAADAGHVIAANNYAWSIEEGRAGTPIDWARAVAYYKRAVEQDYAPSMVSLARRYMDGKGTAVNKAEAIRLLRLAKLKGSTALIQEADVELAKLGAP